MKSFKKQCHRQLLLTRRSPQPIIHGLLFFLIFLLFFPILLPLPPHLLKTLVCGMVWLGTLFVALLTAYGLFQTPYEEGVLQQAYVAGDHLLSVVLAILLVHGLLLWLPIFIIVPFVTLNLGLSFKEAYILDLSLCLGMPTVVSLTALGAAFQVGFIQKVILMVWMIVPLLLPVLIWGQGICEVFLISFKAGLGLCALLLAVSLLSLMSLPFAITAILRLRFEG